MQLGKLIATYHALNIDDFGYWIYVPLGSNCACRKLYRKQYLPVLCGVLHTSIYSCNLHKFIWIRFSKFFNENGPSFLINTMVSMWIILDNFIELEILMKSSTYVYQPTYVLLFQCQIPMHIGICKTDILKIK